MPHRRKIVVVGHRFVPIDKYAFIKLIRYYYKGPNNIRLHFDRRLNCWGEHWYSSRTKTHHIRISPKWCQYNYVGNSNRDFDNKTYNVGIGKLNDYDTVCRILQVTLHEIKHALQTDSNPIGHAKNPRDKHHRITNARLKYEFSLSEAEAEGWSLMHINKAIERYERWCEQ